MKRITSSILVALAASALYIYSSPGVQADAGVPSEKESSISKESKEDTEPQINSPSPVVHGTVVSQESTLSKPPAAGPNPSRSGTESQGASSDSLPSVPTAPKDLKLYYLKGHVQLGWTPKQGETYNVYSSEQPGGKYKLLPMASKVSTGAYTVREMRYHEPTFYVVEAVNSMGKSGYSNEVSSSPNKVTGLKAILNEEDESIRLTWSDSQEGMKYHIYYVRPDGMLASLNDEPVKDRSYLIPNHNMLSGHSGRYALHVITVNEWNVHSEPSNEVALDVRKYPEDRITITDPSVAWPSEDLEEETVPPGQNQTTEKMEKKGN